MVTPPPTSALSPAATLGPEEDSSIHQRDDGDIFVAVAAIQSQIEGENAAANAVDTNRDGATDTAAAADTDTSAADADSDEAWRATHNLTIKGRDETGAAPMCPDPLRTIPDLPFSEKARRVLTKAGFKANPVQAQSWPICEEGRDIISVSRTG